VYTVALQHLPGLQEARLGRALVRRGQGATDEAIDDLFGASDELVALRTIATWYGEDGKTPAQLATWRKLLARAESQHLPALIKEARTMVRALVILVGPADPAAAPANDSPLRRTLATFARRG
jgi:hypothetical protein